MVLAVQILASQLGLSPDSAFFVGSAPNYHQTQRSKIRVMLFLSFELFMFLIKMEHFAVLRKTRSYFKNNCFFFLFFFF